MHFCSQFVFYYFSEQEKKLVVDQVFRDLVKESVVSGFRAVQSMLITCMPKE